MHMETECVTVYRKDTLNNSDTSEETFGLTFRACGEKFGFSCLPYTAEELENTCRKCVKLQVTDTAVLAHILDKRGLEYEILSDTQANVYGELVVSDIVCCVGVGRTELQDVFRAGIRGKSGKLLSQLSGRWQA